MAVRGVRSSLPHHALRQRFPLQRHDLLTLKERNHGPISLTGKQLSPAFFRRTRMVFIMIILVLFEVPVNIIISLPTRQYREEHNLYSKISIGQY